MYICLCNALTDAQVRDAATQGARCPREVFRDCRCQPQCGRCARTVRDILREPRPQLIPAE